MSRCRRDDGRFQSQSLGAAGPQPPRQGSPYRQYGPPSVARFHSPTVVGGQTYFRSKAKDKDRAGYIAKDRIRSTNTAEIQGHSSAQDKSSRGRSPKLNNEDSSVVAARELSWADEVELMLPNSAAAAAAAQGLNANITGDERVKSMNVVEHNAAGMKTAAVSNDLNQKIIGESEGKLSKAVNAYPPTELINGKIKQQIERDHDAAYGKRANCLQPRRGSRKKTLSLNPEEREALENLIEEVLMDGAIESDSASSDDDAGQSESWKTGNIEGQSGTGCETANASAGREEGDQKMRNDKGKMGRKYYPGQLKVALKHMTELPPRFSRKLKKAEKYLELNMMHDSIAATGRIEEEDEEGVAAAKEEKRSSVSPRPHERSREKAKQLKEHQAKEFKRSIRTLLRDHNQYAEDCGALNSSSIHPPGAIICEDLERETLNMQGGARNAELASYTVPSTVQSLMLAAEAISTVDENLSPEGIFLEDEAANRNFIGASDFVHHSYASLYAAQDPHGGGQYVMNVPEFVPAAMVPAYSPHDILRPDQQQQQHVQQYATALYIDQTTGVVSGSGIEPVSRHGLSSESISMVGQVSPNIVPSSSVTSELMSGKMIEFSAAVPPPSMALRTSLAVPIGERTMSSMTSAYASNRAQIHMSTMPSSGALPFYQYQGQNIPPPSVSYGFPMQAPYSSSQYCYMPPSLPPQTLPPAYYPQDQSPYTIDAMHLKPVANPEWSYLKSKQFAENIPTVPGYSPYSNLNAAPIQYPANDPMNSGVNQSSSNFHQRKKQMGSSISPRSMGNSSGIGAGKLSNQRIKQSENLPGTLRTGHRLSQEVIPSSLPLENGQPASAFGDSALKRMQLNVRNRGFGDGSSGYLGRRENRNFASEKYSSQRTFSSDGKKEGRHVALKPKQAKPNQSAMRSRNDVTVVQLHPGKSYHASDLSEEGLESPDNFGDIESGADDWSTDNCDQEVSRKSKQGEDSDTNDESKVGSHENKTVTQDAVAEISEETYVPLAKEIPVNSEENVADKGQSEGLAEQVVTANIDRGVLEPVDGESTTTGLQHSSDVCSAVSEGILHVSEVDRSSLVVENVKKVAEVQARLRLSVCYEDINFVQANSLNLQPAVGEAVTSSICSVEPADGTFMPEEPSVKVISGDADSIDMELIDDAVETDQTPEINLTGMKLVLGSKFICHLRAMFEGCISTGSSDVCLPMTVCLSHSLLTQLHKEMLSQVNLASSSSSQALMTGKKSSEEVETQETTLDLPCDLHAINATSLMKEGLANNMDSNQA